MSHRSPNHLGFENVYEKLDISKSVLVPEEAMEEILAKKESSNGFTQERKLKNAYEIVTTYT